MSTAELQNFGVLLSLKFLLGSHGGNYIVCQTAITSVGSEFSLSSSMFTLCAMQRTSVILLQNFGVSDFSLT
jgi:hypothetical protein